MTDKISLAQALQRAALDLNAAEPPPQLLAAVQARWAPQPVAKPAAAKLHRLPWTWPGAAVAAMSALALVLVGSVLLMLQAPPADQPGLQQQQQQLAQASQGPQGPGTDGSRFVNLVPPERWPREASAAWVRARPMPWPRCWPKPPRARPPKAGPNWACWCAPRFRAIAWPFWACPLTRQARASPCAPRC